MITIQLTAEQAEFLAQAMGSVTLSASAPNAALVVATVAAIRQQIAEQQKPKPQPPKKQEKTK